MHCATHSKGDTEIAARYNEVLVPAELQELGRQLVNKFNMTATSILAVTPIIPPKPQVERLTTLVGVLS